MLKLHYNEDIYLYQYYFQEIGMSFYKDINKFGVNTVERYASGFPISKDGGKKTVSLNGLWDFMFVPSVLDIPQDYYRLDYNLSGFTKIKVPSNWQLQGFDTPIYTNVAYPYALESKNLFRIPHIKDKLNSAGCYVTFFEIDNLDDNIYINFGGINSAGEVYVNGEFVGYSEDSFGCQEYDITRFVKIGINKLAVTVYRYCTGSYLEDQDFWRISGIFRDVFLIFKPKVQIADYYAISEFEKDYTNGKLILEASVESLRHQAADAALICTLKDAEGAIVFEEKVKVGLLEDGKKAFVKFEHVQENVRLWSHEEPYLYTLTLTLLDGEEFLDQREGKFGFREVKIVPYKEGRGPFILLNGKPLKFCGVNRHDFHPDYAHAVPYEVTKADIELCKRHNITAIRTAHYPSSRFFYDLCDEYGILVMCECNLETHGLAFMIPRNNKKWTENCVYRMRNMVNTFKNHACIVSWSLGNEAGFGTAFKEMREAALAIDKTRFIHYHPDTTAEVGDVVSDMYTRQEKMKLIGENKTFTHCPALWKPTGTKFKPDMYRDKPFMLCEYSHAMGNSLGNFSDYWDEFKKYDRLAGGFIWDFADQSIKVVEDNVVQYRYGGDFGDKPNSGSFAFNGIFRADREPNPSLYEVVKQYQQVDFILNNNSILIKNRYMFTNLEVFSLKLELLFDGVVDKTTSIDAPSIEPGESASIELPFTINNNVDKEVLVNIYLLTKTANAYSPKGHIVASEQFILAPSAFVVKAMEGSSEVAVNNSVEVIINSGDLQVVIDKKSGGITNILKDGKERLRDAIFPQFCRATIDNDSFPQVPTRFLRFIAGKGQYKLAQKFLRPRRVKVESKDGFVTVVINWKMPLIRRLTTYYTFGCGDCFDIGMQVSSYRNMERYGFTFALREGVDGVEFYGKGPHENYVDRATSAYLGVYAGKASDFIHDYLMPQENGNHTGVRWLDVGGEDGFRIEANGSAFEASVHPYTLDVLDDAKHLHELNRLNFLTVNIDGKQRGVGGDVPAIAMLKPQYKIKRGERHSIKFRININ